MQKIKKSIPNLQTATDEMAIHPTISFSHLASCFSEVENGDDSSVNVYGFPSPVEERLYETGTLVKEFLKC
jgi:hypothetical protein